MSTQMQTMNGWSLGQEAIFFGVALLLYFFFCYCLKCIVEKCGTTPGILVWIPILQIIPLLRAGGVPIWFLILLFIPIVNIIAGVYMWVKVCQARGKSGWLVILMFIPLLGLFFIPYLAFSE
jgi:hypothetical protein